MDIEKAKNTIRHLLNLANDPAAAAGEIANAMRFAAKLMEQHQLGEDEIDELDEKLIDLERAEMARSTVFGSSRNLAYWEQVCAAFAAKLVGGVSYYSATEFYQVGGIAQLDRNGQPTYRRAVVFYGVAEDVELARQVYAEVVTTIAAMSRLRYGAVFRGAGRDYCEGFAEALHGKLVTENRESRQLAERTGGTALVAMESRTAMVDRKRQLADDWLRDVEGIRLSSGSTSRAGTSSQAAYQQGRSDGSRYDASAARRKKLTV